MAATIGHGSAHQPPSSDPLKVALMKAKKKMAEIAREKEKSARVETAERKRAVELQRNAAREALAQMAKEAAKVRFQDPEAIMRCAYELGIDTYGSNAGISFDHVHVSPWDEDDLIES